MFPDNDTFLPMQTMKDFDRWLSRQPTSSFTSKLWYIIGNSHMATTAKLDMNGKTAGLLLASLGEFFDQMEPVTSALASLNEVELNEVEQT